MFHLLSFFNISLQKFRQNYGDNRQTDSYYAEYLDFIERKVVAQRLKLQKEREEEERRAKEREEEEVCIWCGIC